VLIPSRGMGGEAGVGAGAACVGCLMFLLAGWEGLICVLMSLPLAAPMGALGGMLVHAARARRKEAASGWMLALVPWSIAWDVTATPPVRPVVTAVEIAAPPAAVWKRVVEFPPLEEPQEWYFRAGLAYPQSAQTIGNVRYCRFSTGDFVEPISVREEPRLLAFDVAENPPPMRELSLCGKVEPRHLHGYMESVRGQFLLIPIDGGRRTRLEGTTWYRHGLWPDFYWRLWSDAVIHRIHLRVLRHIQRLTEEAERR
jgi:hypothetical protein